MTLALSHSAYIRGTGQLRVKGPESKNSSLSITVILAWDIRDLNLLTVER